MSIKENQGLLKFESPKVCTYFFYIVIQSFFQILLNDLQSKSIKLIDIPGHESIRLKHFDEFKVSAG